MAVAGSPVQSGPVLEPDVSLMAFDLQQLAGDCADKNLVGEAALLLFADQFSSKETRAGESLCVLFLLVFSSCWKICSLSCLCFHFFIKFSPYSVLPKYVTEWKNPGVCNYPKNTSTG